MRGAFAPPLQQSVARRRRPSPRFIRRAKRKRFDVALPAAPVRPNSGRVTVSVEALYKMALAALSAGLEDEASALFTAAKNAADADERAAHVRPYGQDGPRP